MNDFLTIAEVITLAKISRTTVYRLVKAGKLTPYNLGGGKKIFFKRSDVEALYQPVQASSVAKDQELDDIKSD